MYQNEVRDHFKTEHEGLAYQEVLKLIGESWKILDEDAKKVSFFRSSLKGGGWRRGDETRRELSFSKKKRSADLFSISLCSIFFLL